MDAATIDLSTLTDDGDELDLGDGRRLRLHVRPDESSTFDDAEWGDCYGHTALPGRENDYGHAPRPEGFDGNAELLHVGRGHYGLWWQPPADVKRTDPSFPALRQLVLDICEYGFYTVGLELLEGEDAYHRAIVRDAQWIGGVEPFPGEYLTELVTELAAELTGLDESDRYGIPPAGGYGMDS